MDTSLSGADGYLDVTVFQSLFKEASIMAAFEHENVLRLEKYPCQKGLHLVIIKFYHIFHANANFQPAVYYYRQEKSSWSYFGFHG